MPKLSIIMPTYNGARYINEQVDSILAQDDDDFEMIAVDDGSTDDTPFLLNEFSKRDRRFRVIPSSGNIGQNNRLAQLLDVSSSDYIAIADQDDRWATNRNSLLFSSLNGRPMAFGRSELIDGSGKLRGQSLLEVLNLQPGSTVKLRALIQPMFSAHATIIEREILTKSTLYSPLPFDWLMALQALFSRGLVYVDQAHVFHRIHGNNQVNNIKVETRRYSSDHLRWLLLFRNSARQRLWLVLDFLSRSTVIDSSLRREFRNLAVRCYTVWFSEWRSLRTDGGLKRSVLEAMEPLAGNQADYNWFKAEMELLTGSAVGVSMRKEVRRRLFMK